MSNSGTLDSSALSSPSSGPDFSDGVEWAARLGYGAKGVVYAVVGALALQQAVGQGGDVGGTREALQEIASGPFGTTLLAIVALGLAGYAVWRTTQALFDPEGEDDDGMERWAVRAFYLASAVVYGFLTWSAISLLTDAGSGSSSGSQTGGLLAHSWGVWVIGAAGVGTVARGGWQLWKAYTERFKEKIERFDLGPARSRWVVRISQIGLTARGLVFGLIGGSLIHAALTRNPENAESTGGALEAMVGNPWILGSVGVGLICYSVYQWVKARFRIIGV